MDLETCRLCFKNQTECFQCSSGKSKNEVFFQCQLCGFIFKGSQHFLSLEEEKKRYELHKNDLQDSGYRQFLESFILNFKDFVKESDEGLDFGSGPTPALSNLLQELGFKMQIYDPFFAPFEPALQRSYDFVTVCEVVEHFYHPAREFLRLYSLLRSGGVLAVHTSLSPSPSEFSRWGYHRDPTHVGFFNESSVQWLCSQLSFQLLRISKRGFVLRALKN